MFLKTNFSFLSKIAVKHVITGTNVKKNSVLFVHYFRNIKLMYHSERFYVCLTTKVSPRTLSPEKKSIMIQERVI